MQFDFSFFPRVLSSMFGALGVTLGLALYTFIASLILGFLLSLLLLRPVVVATRFAKIWISFFRGTPLLAQFFFIYFGLAQIFPILATAPPFWSAVFIMSLHYSAYMAVIIETAALAVDSGQMEACLSTGMSYFQSLFRIILPQACVVAIPNLFNSFLDIIKGTSMAFTIGVVEMMAAAQIEAAAYYRYLEAYTAVILLYWVMNLLFGLIEKSMARRVRRAY